MNMKNQIIIDKIDFFVNNFNDTGIDYKVEVYTLDIEESDMYGIDIYKIPRDTTEVREHISTLYADSCGGCLEHEVPYTKLTEIEEYVLSILFKEVNEGIIRGF